MRWRPTSASRGDEPGGGWHARTPTGQEVLRVEGLVKHFDVRGGLLHREAGRIHAVDGISFDLRAGQTLGLVGESGCGKSTTVRAVARLLDVTDGRIVFKGRDITRWSQRRLRPVRRELQVVFQDPYASLNPRMPVGDIVAEPLRIHGLIHGRGERGHERRVADLLELVGLSAEHASRFPHEFSGGQRQRIGIARALALDPQVLILDEPVSALDVSIQAQILNLLRRLQDELGLAYLFIGHDLSVVRHLCDRVAVMYLGKIVETGSTSDIYDRPTHPYTQALLSAVPVPDPTRRRRRQRIVLEGEIPSLTAPPSGCRFRTRCFKAEPRCAREEPLLVDGKGLGHPSACLFAEPADPRAG